MLLDNMEGKLRKELFAIDLKAKRRGIIITNESNKPNRVEKHFEDEKQVKG